MTSPNLALTTNQLKRHPAFAIVEAEREVPPDSATNPQFLFLEKSLEEMESISKSLSQLSITQESVAREMGSLTRHSSQTFFFELRRRLAEAYLPIMDSIEQLTQVLSEGVAAGELPPALAEGARDIEAKGVEYLDTMGVQPVSTIGEIFDPRFHKLVEIREAPPDMAGLIIDEVVRGYRLGDRIIRTPQVVVAEKK
jgi:molecular chaperone GrpE